ncbi:MAG: hypothetical protein H8E57_02945 [Candidatus Cloacimonetes bacterium]|nr:hypothetical protein [Candidatus Cloacimonadota bacterium]
MKTIIFFTLLFVFITLSAQTGYVWERHSFNAAGGVQSGTTYTSVTSFGNYAQGEVVTNDYTGYFGFLFPQLDQRPPLITSIDDVPNDQGLQVQVVWNKCAFDDVYAIDTYYSIWRYDEDFERATGDNPTNLRMFEERDLRNVSNDSHDSKQQTTKTENWNILPSTENTYTEPWKVVEQFQKDPNKTYFWQRDGEVWTFIDEVPALQYDEYALIAPTLADSNAVDINYATFKAVYHDLYEYYESYSDSGYSVDNIPPDETITAIAQNGNYMRLSWEEVEYGTLAGNSYPELNGIWYKIYASDSPDFVCDETTYLETVTDLNYDYPLSGEDKKFFKIVVSDKP